MAVTTEAELGEAIKNGEETIEVQGDLTNKVFKIKATGKVAWAIAFGAIAVAVIVALGSGGAGAPISALVGAGAVTVLGLPTAISAVLIAVAAGGAQSLNKLRKYRISENSSNRIILKLR